MSHELGLLPGVDTYWVKEAHGALPKNDDVLDDADRLLRGERPEVLHERKPARRGLGEPDEWVVPASTQWASLLLNPR